MDNFLHFLKSKRFKYYLIAFFVFFLFTIFTFLDFQISLSIVNYNSKFGHFMENFGMIIAPILCMLAGIIGCVYSKKHAGISNRGAKLLFWRSCVFISLIITNIILLISDFPIICIFIIFALNPFMYYVAYNLPLAKLKYLFKMAMLTIVYVVSFLLIVQFLKTVWGRVRFYDLENLAQFSRWYVIQGINGHKSFPSGHTANAMSVYVLSLLNSIIVNKKFKVLNWSLISLWILLMGYSRVLVGAHYCSDVLFSIVFGVFWFYVCKYLVARQIVNNRQKYIDEIVVTKQNNIKSTIISKDGEEI